jgi:hypothetical protein
MSRYARKRPLVVAVNRLAGYGEKLPKGWKITLEFWSDEASISLEDPDGNDVDFDYGDDAFAEAVEMANYRQRHRDSATRSGAVTPEVGNSHPSPSSPHPAGLTPSSDDSGG